MCGLHRFDAELRIKGGWQSAILIAALVGAASLFESIPGLAAGKQTFTGEVGDAMCGVKHMPGEGTPAEIRAGGGRQDLCSEYERPGGAGACSNTRLAKRPVSLVL
jgi:hypothetical protein